MKIITKPDRNPRPGKGRKTHEKNRRLLDDDGVLKTSQVEKILDCSKPTALREMKTLVALGVADLREAELDKGRPEQMLKLADKFKWFSSPECKALRWRNSQTQGGNS